MNVSKNEIRAVVLFLPVICCVGGQHSVCNVKSLGFFSNLSIFGRSYFKQSLTSILIDIRENRVRVETLREMPIMLYCELSSV